MQAKNSNRKLYSKLRQKASKNLTIKSNIKEITGKVRDSLMPKNEKPTKTEDTDYKGLLNKVKKDYDGRLQALARSNDNKLKKELGATTDKIKQLQDQLTHSTDYINRLNSRNSTIFSSLNNQIKKLAQQKEEDIKKNSVPQTNSGNVAGNALTDDTQASFYDEGEVLNSDTALNYSSLDNPVSDLSIIYDSDRNLKRYASNVASQVNQSSVTSKLPIRIYSTKAGIPRPNVFLNMGDYRLKVSNLFGTRSGANAVGHINSNEHSGGIDLRVYKGTTPQDIPLSVAPGKIVKIGKDGYDYFKKLKKNSNGGKAERSGGIYVYVQLDEDPNKIIKYMHLPKNIYNNSSQWLNKHVERGDVFPGTGSSGIGSAPHFKISLGTYDPKTGKSAMDYAEEKNNPTNILLTGKL